MGDQSNARRLFAKVITVSDGVAAGTRQDRSGAALSAVLGSHGFSVEDHIVVADGVDSVATALSEMCAEFSGLVVTTGGTGFGPRDLTPEGTRKVLEREAPGIAEAIRIASNSQDRPFGLLSRGVAGVIGESLVVNVPGSSSGAVESLEAIVAAVPHALELLAGHRPH